MMITHCIRKVSVAVNCRLMSKFDILDESNPHFDSVTVLSFWNYFKVPELL